eukprot:8008730-Prorocentrum_lima.AAC.1
MSTRAWFAPAHGRTAQPPRRPPGAAPAKQPKKKTAKPVPSSNCHVPRDAVRLAPVPKSAKAEMAASIHKTRTIEWATGKGDCEPARETGNGTIPLQPVGGGAAHPETHHPHPLA